MAFVETARWQIETCGDSRVRVLVLPAWASDRRGRQILGMSLTLIVHLALAIMLVDLMLRSPQSVRQDQSPLKVLSLAPSGMKPDAMQEQQPVMEQAPRSVATPAPPEPQIPVEWSMSRIRVAMASPIQKPVAVTVPPVAAVSQGSAGAGPGSSGTYDPYAGASPQRQADTAPSAIAGPLAGRTGSQVTSTSAGTDNSNAMIVWDATTVAAITKVMGRRFPDAHGPIRITLRVLAGRSKPEIQNIAGPVGGKGLAYLRRLLAQAPARRDIQQAGFTGSVMLNI